MANLSGFKVKNIEMLQIKFPEIIHQWASAYIAREKFLIKDKKILKAIAFHTTGYKKMSKLAKLIYISDFASYDRNFIEAIKIRKIAFSDIEKAFKMTKKYKLNYLKKNNKFIYGE